MERYPFYSMNELGDYDVMILTKHPCWFYEQQYRVTDMDRSLLIAEPVNGIEGQKVLLATSHFESMDSAEVRKV